MLYNLVSDIGVINLFSLISVSINLRNFEKQLSLVIVGRIHSAIGKIIDNLTRNTLTSRNRKIHGSETAISQIKAVVRGNQIIPEILDLVHLVFELS